MKQKILLLILICGILTSNVIAQQGAIVRQKVIGGSSYDESWCVLKTKDGGMIVGGFSYSNKSAQKTQNIRGASDYWIVKMDQHGKIEWDKTIGGNGDDYFQSLIQTSDGGYALIGFSYSNISIEKNEDNRGDADYWMVKLDSLGNIKWDKTIGGSGAEYINYIRQTSDDGYILAGSSNSNISGEKTENSRGGFDYWIVKLNKKGEKVWDKTIGGSGDEFCSSVIITSDGGVALGGGSVSNASGEKSENSRGDFDCWIVKLSKFGKIEWDKTVGGSDGDFCQSLLQTADGGYLIGAQSLSNTSGEKTQDSRGLFDYWLVKLNKNGKKVWDKTIGGNDNDGDVFSLLQTEDKGYIVGGDSYSGISGEKTESSRGDWDNWIVKLDKNMNIQWDKTIGGSDREALYGSAIQEVKKNLYAIVSLSASPISGDKTIAPIGDADYWLVLLDGSHPLGISANSNNADEITAKQNSNNETFSVYPIPVKDILYVRANGKVSLLLINQSGKQVLAQTIENNGTINVANLPAGIYYLKNSATGRTQRVMIVK